jgi:hypothetical protein
MDTHTANLLPQPTSTVGAMCRALTHGSLPTGDGRNAKHRRRQARASGRLCAEAGVVCRREEQRLVRASDLCAQARCPKCGRASVMITAGPATLAERQRRDLEPAVGVAEGDLPWSRLANQHRENAPVAGISGNLGGVLGTSIASSWAARRRRSSCFTTKE